MTWMCTDNKELAKAGSLKRPSLSMVTTWLKYPWEDIPAEIVKKSFLKTDISNSMDGTEDTHLWQDAWDTDEHLTQQEWEDLFF